MNSYPGANVLIAKSDRSINNPLPDLVDIRSEFDLSVGIAQ